MTPELKACPFCGSDDVRIDKGYWRNQNAGYEHTNFYYFYAVCNECHSKSAELPIEDLIE